MQILVDDESKKYLVINTHLSLYKYKHLIFDIYYALAIFQKYMAQLLCNIDNCFLYLDDIIILIFTQLDHDKILCKVLDLLQ